MTCLICGRAPQFHGSEVRPGIETGCHDGVLMDDDEYFEGWQQDVIYPPCPHNPAMCGTCCGSGEAPEKVAARLMQDDCPDCNGTGWRGGNAQWPTPEAAEVDK